MTELDRVDWVFEEVMRQIREMKDGPGKKLVDRKEIQGAFLLVLRALRQQVTEILMGVDVGNTTQ